MYWACAGALGWQTGTRAVWWGLDARREGEGGADVSKTLNWSVQEGQCVLPW